MKILFGTKYYNKEISEVPSGFLIWIIEEMKTQDWSLIQECKKELSARLKIEWTYPPKPLTHNEIISAFKRSIIDAAYKGGTSEKDCKYIAQEHTSWIPLAEEINVGEIVVSLLHEIDQLKKEKSNLLRIIKIHGIDMKKFLSSHLYTLSLLVRCQRDSAVRLPDEFYKSGNFGESELQLYTKN